ncbi:hypothetical protein OG898_10115 [Streptomyces sp. NBC_00193]|uniref:hypothetical protein n=1 Tax=Streptomyces sp. NBC_00193 TaxID=2975675 RepID=UPI00225AE778|nr:hypothetical protein [Streptomyces sp. NBC_00193]MCX5296844.1 hypothetical protein [Streptomyces sp. NBC_00193]
MSHRPRSSLKSLTQTPTGPSSAEPAPAADGSGAPKVVAEGVPSSLRPDPHPADGRYVVAVLHICAPRGAVPTATSKCECGHDRSAVGQRNVLALIQLHTDHRDVCPLGRVANTRRKAA